MAEQSSADYRGSLGRYALYGEIAAGGMATVHLARLLGPVGFSRTVAIKRLHPHLAKDPDFVGMFLEEARLAARVRHPNVVSTLDVVSEDGELFLVMEYVAGESLSRLVRKSREGGRVIPVRYVLGIICGTLDGLHAAHEAKSERGQPLGLVHRDVSPQNVHIGSDGVARVLDFGIAKATNRVQETRTDQIKGKVAYMSPEQLAKGNVDRRADIYSASVVLWEALTGERLFKADDVPSLVYSIINDDIRPPSYIVPTIPAGLDDVVMKGLERESEKRWSSAREMAEALEKVLGPPPSREIGRWVEETAGDALEWRQELVHRIESETSSSMPPPMRIDSPSSPIEVTSGVSGVRAAEAHAAEVARAEAPTITNEGGSSPPSLVSMPPPRPMDPSLWDARASEARSRTGLVAMIFAGALLVVVGGLFGLRWIQMIGEAPTATDDPAPRASDSAEPAIVLGEAQRTTSDAGAVSSASAAPSAASTHVGFTTTSSATHVVHGVPSAVPHDDCADPFITDNRGIRHPKPQCFKH